MPTVITKHRLLDPTHEDVVCLVVCHNETEKLNAFFAFYRNIGIRQFWFIDNNSDDGTFEYLMEQPDTAVFRTDGSYGEDHKGLRWSRKIADTYLDGKWILTVDVDELFIWPGYPGISLVDFISYCDQHDFHTVLALMIDFFPASETWASFSGENDFLKIAPNFCNYPFSITRSRHFPFLQIKGGVRSLMIGDIHRSPLLQKMPLMKWKKGSYYLKSTHFYSEVRPMCDMLCVLAHFKFSGTSQEKFQLEIDRGQRWQGGLQYKKYLEGVKNDGIMRTNLSAKTINRFEELVDYGYLRTSPRYQRFLETRDSNVGFIQKLQMIHPAGFPTIKAFWPVIRRLNSSKWFSHLDPAFEYDIDDIQINDINSSGNFS